MTAPIVWTGTRIDRTDITGGGTMNSVMPAGASVGDRCIVCICCFGFESGYAPEDSTNPHITPPDPTPFHTEWLPYYQQGEVDDFSAGDSGFNDIWMFSWIKYELEADDGFTFPDTLDWDLNTNDDQYYTLIMVTQTFSGGEPFFDFGNLNGWHGDQSNTWDSASAGAPSSDGAALGSRWLYSYFGGFTVLTNPYTGHVPTATWTDIDGPNGGSHFEDAGGLDNPTFGYYINSGSSSPSCRLASEYHLTTVVPGKRLQMAEPVATSIHGTFTQVPWLVEPGASLGGDIWGWGP